MKNVFVYNPYMAACTMAHVQNYLSKVLMSAHQWQYYAKFDHF